MEIVYLSRSNSGKPHPFVEEQAAALIKNFNVKIEHFLITGGGVAGYIKAVLQLREFIKANQADIVHVHYGLSALVAVINKFIFLKKYKIIITYHGSDINKKSERQFSLLAAKFASHNILVSEKMHKYFSRNCSIIPCGINTNIALNRRDSTRASYGWSSDDFVILFSSSFDRKEKDPGFAFQVVDALSKVATKSVRFIELKGYSRDQLNNLMQAADALIMCSKREGSPQVIKEAILNALPVVSNDVGEVMSICEGVDNCFIIPKEVTAYTQCLLSLSQNNARIQNRNQVMERFNNDLISERIFNIYTQTLN